MTDLVQRQVLRALFCLSRDTRPISAVTLAEACGITPTRAAGVLVALERGGWVDASRARLTLRGLALATRIKDGAGGLGQKPRAGKAPPIPRAIAAPWAAASDLTLSIASGRSTRPYAIEASPRSAGVVPLTVSDSPSPGGRALERGLLGATGNGLHS